MVMGSLLINSSWIRHLSKTTTLCRRRLSTQVTRPITLTPSTSELFNIDTFREKAFKPQKPFLFGRNDDSPAALLPAATKWFEKHTTNSGVNSTKFSPYMDKFQEWGFPYELVTPSASNKEALLSFRSWLSSSEEPVDQLLASILEPSIEELETGSFFQLLAPLRLLMKALEFNQIQPEPVSLYIAQSSLTDLPEALQKDLPTPDVVQSAGKGDVYSSSIWLGTEPTYTPLHRDPNPNVFCQLCSKKIIRLMAPALGDRLYFQVQSRIRQQGNSRIRTVEMMEGKEREALYEAVWEHDPLPEGLYEAELGPGDALFIPNGWWHSVKSKGSWGHLNGSVNWWFR